MDEDRFRGAVLGFLAGDMYGAPFEGTPGAALRDTELPAEFAAGQHLGVAGIVPGGRYTDDSNQMLATAASVCDHDGAVDGLDIVRRCAQFAVDNPRGYPGSVQALFERVRAGDSLDVLATCQFPDGSYGNGGPCKILPVALMYAGMGAAARDRLAAAGGLTALVAHAIRGSHAHADAVEAACVLAAAIDFNLHTSAAAYDGHAMLQHVLSSATRPGSGMHRRVSALHRHLHRPTWASLFMLLSEPAGDDTGARVEDYYSMPFQIEATTATACALWAFLDGPVTRPPLEAFQSAVRLGGDTDSIAAMTGALLGSLLGTAALPAGWLDRMENGPYGRDFADQLARRLHALATQQQ